MAIGLRGSFMQIFKGKDYRIRSGGLTISLLRHQCQILELQIRQLVITKYSIGSKTFTYQQQRFITNLQAVYLFFLRRSILLTALQKKGLAQGIYQKRPATARPSGICNLHPYLRLVQPFYLIFILINKNQMLLLRPNNKYY